MRYAFPMQSPLNDSANPVATTIALSVAPAAAGAGLGMLIGDSLDRSSRRAAAVTLLGIAFLAVTPLLTSLVKKRVTGPRSRRGNAKTLEKIRDGGVGEYGYDGYNFDEFDPEDAPTGL
jgi:hypothetical protein